MNYWGGKAGSAGRGETDRMAAEVAEEVGAAVGGVEQTPAGTAGMAPGRGFPERSRADAMGTKVRSEAGGVRWARHWQLGRASGERWRGVTAARLPQAARAAPAAATAKSQEVLPGS